MTQKKSDVSENLKPLTLKQFEDFMVSYGHGWTLINKNEKFATYQKIVTAQNGSCLVAVLLLLLGLIPGILYLIYGRKPSSTHQLAVSVDTDGALRPSGDTEGMKVYHKFINIREGKKSSTDIKEWISIHPVLFTIIVIILFIIIMNMLINGQ